MKAKDTLKLASLLKNKNLDEKVRESIKSKLALIKNDKPITK